MSTIISLTFDLFFGLKAVIECKRGSRYSVRLLIAALSETSDFSLNRASCRTNEDNCSRCCNPVPN